ncbi:MAG: diaminopimelate epimerase [bacterium]
MKFVKYHGCGNDYIFFDATKYEIKNPDKLAVRLCNRHFGVGGDGIILVLPSDKADIRMQMHNVDGTIAEMCGNGLRCFVKFIYDYEIFPRRLCWKVETGYGILQTELFNGKNKKIEMVKINLGIPITNGLKIPVRIDKDPVLDYSIKALDRTFKINCISMGNPHTVIYVSNLKKFNVAKYGRYLENHTLFPNRTNVEFVELISEKEVIQRTWERGCGETLACGTGAAAVCAAGLMSGRTREKILVHLSGGDLELDWTGSRNLFLTGPAVEVFHGEI